MTINDELLNTLMSALMDDSHDKDLAALLNWRTYNTHFSKKQDQKVLARLNEALEINPNHSNALFLRGYLHAEGRGGPVNDAEAIRLYEKAIELNNADAMYWRAVMHKNGQGGPVNDAEAIRLYEKAIELNNADAMNSRAAMYQHRGGPVNHAAAIRLYEKAIELNSIYAMYNRALMHQKGQGGPVNNAAAVEFYYRAFLFGSDSVVRHLARRALDALAEKACIEASYYLILIYLVGRASDRNLLLAKKYFEKAPVKITNWLCHKALEQLDAENPDIENAQRLQDFLNENKCNAPHIDKLLNHIQLKLLLAHGQPEEALIFFDRHYIIADDLMPKNLFELANAQFFRLENVTEKEEKITIIKKACDLLYPAYVKGDANSERLLIRFLRVKDEIEKGYTFFSPIDDDSAEVDKNLINRFVADFNHQDKQIKLAAELGAIKAYIAIMKNEQPHFSRFFL